MNRQNRERSALGATFSQIYGYIYCMLVSNALLGMPLYGGLLYLCGRTVRVFGFAYSRKNRKLTPSYARGWGLFFPAVLSVISIALTAVYPVTPQHPGMWLVFAMVMIILSADLSVEVYNRILYKNEKPTRRSTAFFMMIQILLVFVAGAWLIVNLDKATGISLTAGFMLWVFLQCYSERQLFFNIPEDENVHTSAPEDISTLQTYRSYTWIGLMLVAAVELTITSAFALVATTAEDLLPALAAGLLCNVGAAEAGVFFLYRMERKKQRDPTFMLCFGLAIWLCGVLVCIHLLRRGNISFLWICGCLLLCGAGGALCLIGLSRIEALLPGLAKLTGKRLPENYQRTRRINWEYSRLLGDTLSLLTLIIVAFTTRSDMPHSLEEARMRFQPILFLPVLLVVTGTLLSVIRFPMSSRYIQKLRRFLQLKDTGEENAALKKQLETVVTGNYRQPYLSGFLIFIFRLFYRHKLVNADHIRPDDQNPLVFLCNHSEIYGPIVCKISIPVPVRSWTISLMMLDRQEVTEYVYVNTFSKILWLPVFVRKLIARVIGWLSYTVMNQIEAIPVYRGQPMKLRETIRKSIDAMEAGDNLLIFPESMEHKYQREGIGELSPGFVMLADAYWKKTGKRMRMLPIYANRAGKTLTFGTEIWYNPESSFSDEQRRICAETREQILHMAGLKNTDADKEGRQPENETV